MSQQPAILPRSAAHDNSPGSIRGFFIFITIITILSISLRFWSRCIRSNAGLGAGRHTQRLWWDDWAALAAVVSDFVMDLPKAQKPKGVR